MVTYKAKWIDSYYCGKCRSMFFTVEEVPEDGHYHRNDTSYCPYCGGEVFTKKEDRLIINPKNWWDLDDNLRFQPVS